MVSVNIAEQAIYKVLAQRQRSSARTDVNQMHRLLNFMGENIPYEDIVRAFKHMQDKGLGTLVVGRNNNPDRFKWNYNLKEVARAARGEKIEAQPIEKSKPRTKNKKMQLVINIDTSKTNAKDVDALITLAKSLEGK